MNTNIGLMRSKKQFQNMLLVLMSMKKIKYILNIFIWLFKNLLMTQLKNIVQTGKVMMIKM